MAKKSEKTKLGGSSILLTFMLTQHSRDENLMQKLVDYFGCGFYNKRSNSEIGDYQCGKFLDNYEKIIPFFQRHKVIGEKAHDFQDWRRVAELVKNKAHLTSQGLDEIIKIKSQMNSQRLDD